MSRPWYVSISTSNMGLLGYILKLVVSLNPFKTSLSRSGGNEREATILCMHTTPMPASFAWRVWQVMINGSTNFGLRTRSLSYLVTGHRKWWLGFKHTSCCLSFWSRRQCLQFIERRLSSLLEVSIYSKRSKKGRQQTFRRSAFFRFDSWMRCKSSACRNWEDISDQLLYQNMADSN